MPARARDTDVHVPRDRTCTARDVGAGNVRRASTSTCLASRAVPTNPEAHQVCTVRARAAYLFAIYAAVAYQSSHTWALRIGPPMQGGVI